MNHLSVFWYAFVSFFVGKNEGLLGNFEMSPDGDTMAFLRQDGYINMVSTKVCAYVVTARIEVNVGYFHDIISHHESLPLICFEFQLSVCHILWFFCEFKKKNYLFYLFDLYGFRVL